MKLLVDLAPKLPIAVSAAYAEIKRGALLTLDTAKNRVRLLPLSKQ